MAHRYKGTQWDSGHLLASVHGRDRPVPDPAPGRDLAGYGSLCQAMVTHRLLAHVSGAVYQKGPGVMVMMSVDEAFAKLEQLHAETADADPFQPAPPIWIAWA